MEYYYMISMDEFWKLDSNIINFVSQRWSKESALVGVSSELTTYIEQFNNINEMSIFSSQNGFWYVDPVNAPITPYIPENDDPILRGEVGP
jgi:hypothetical protein